MIEWIDKELVIDSLERLKQTPRSDDESHLIIVKAVNAGIETAIKSVRAIPAGAMLLKKDVTRGEWRRER